MNLLLVEDNPHLYGALNRALSPRGIRLACCADGLEALDRARRRRFDAVLIDLPLTCHTRVQMLQCLGASRIATPLIGLVDAGAALDAAAHRHLGIDDSLAKPVNPAQLEALVRAHMQRYLAEQDVRCGLLRVDRHTGGCFLQGAGRLRLSRREAALLTALMQRRGQVVGKQVLRDIVFGPQSGISDHAVETLAHRLRKRIEGSATLLLTVRGVGYLLTDDPCPVHPHH